jgi:hypothetical protein
VLHEENSETTFNQIESDELAASCLCSRIRRITSDGKPKCKT